VCSPFSDAIIAMRVVVSLTVLLPLLLVAGAAANPNVITRRRVNWWFNALNSSFGSHQAAVAAAHRQAITGVYQWIQPAGFWVKADGSVLGRAGTVADT